ncbi:MAG TPA: hypothetical protein VJN90_03310 [Candidatus Acidoferrales bacterium]|nr:hypothetical protein [Candidatus Acidoferrales bacterium]
MQVETCLEAYENAVKLVSDLPQAEYRVEAFRVLFTRLLDDSEGRSSVIKQRDADGPGKGTKSHTKQRILELRQTGNFDKPQSPQDVSAALKLAGFHHNDADVRMTLLRLAQKKELRRVQGGPKAFKYVRP